MVLITFRKNNNYFNIRKSGVRQNLPYGAPCIGICLWLVNGMTVWSERIMNFSLHGITPTIEKQLMWIQKLKP